MDPVEALNEIAFRMELALAPTFKIQAFRRASAALAGLTSDQVAAKLADGSLARTKGIGSSTLQVIKQAVSGEVPERLAALRADAATVLSSAGAELAALIRGDLHTHSTWSDGGASLEVMAQTGRSLGREYQAATDHSPNLTIANGLTGERLGDQIALIDELNDQWDSFRLLKGIEVDILESGELDQTPDMFDQLDVVVGSVHSKLRASAAEMTARMLAGIGNPYLNVLGHCTGQLVRGSRAPRPRSEFDAPRVFAACAHNDVAVEINARPEREDPPDDLIELALAEGCLFSIDSDAHAPGQLAFLDYGIERAAQHGIPADRIITTWPRERLADWVHQKRPF